MKAKHNQYVRGTPLVEGQLVYLQDYGNRTHHNIQDLWSSVIYQVVWVPPEGGAIYSIALLDYLSKIKTVHRSMLKSQVQSDSPKGELLLNFGGA